MKTTTLCYLSNEKNVEEETGYRPIELEQGGYIEFYWEGKPEWSQVCYLFRGKNFQGGLRESDECLPKWLTKDGLPWNQMWPDDKYWLADFFRGKEVTKRCYFGRLGEIIKIVDI